MLPEPACLQVSPDVGQLNRLRTLQARRARKGEREGGSQAAQELMLRSGPACRGRGPSPLPAPLLHACLWQQLLRLVALTLLCAPPAPAGLQLSTTHAEDATEPTIEFSEHSVPGARRAAPRHACKGRHLACQRL